MVNGNILIVDDDEEILVALMLFLREHFTIVDARKNPQDALACLNSQDIDVFILDMNLSPDASKGREGIELMNTIRRIDHHAVIVFIIEWGDAELANAAIKAGANNYIQKPWDDLKLLATIRSAMDLSKSRQLVETLREQQRNHHIDQHNDHQMVYGRSRLMEELMKTVDKVAGTASNVMILGENGIGKELLAREIHLRSERKAGVFIKVDLGSLSESLAERELFGYVKGAFTDANMDKPGCFEMASGGTIFFDEITNITSSLQVKLLNILKNREVTKLGSNLAMAFDTRIISATNSYLNKIVFDKTIHEDLLSCLNTIRIGIPPLRRRMEDLPLLVDFFLNKLREKYKKNIGISSGALKKLEKHHWPGNIRELQNTLEKAVILADHNTLSERDFLFKSRLIPAEGIDMVDLKHNEKEIIKKAILLNGGNLSRAARHLGISRRTLYNKISKYEI
jgi:two-component system response regulator HydG